MSKRIEFQEQFNLLYPYIRSFQLILNVKTYQVESYNGYKLLIIEECLLYKVELLKDSLLMKCWKQKFHSK